MMKSTTSYQRTNRSSSSAGPFVLWVYIGTTWLFMSILIIPSVFLLWLRYIHGPTLQFPYEVGKGMLEEDCEVTTHDYNDLVVDSETTREQAKETVSTHGTAIVKNVLSPNTADEFLQYVLKANQELTSENQVYVHENEHRYNLLPDTREPSVQRAMSEISHHPKLRPLIDDMMGPSATLINISVLTVEYGASDQTLHSDTSSSVATYPDYFVPEYSLVLALQDTTKEMGATQLCPGTQRCQSTLGEDDEEDLNEHCNIRATLSKGDAFLYISDLHHRGTAHVDPKAPPRAYVFVIFAGTRVDKNDRRMLPLGQVRALQLHLWGHTIDEFDTIGDWKIWHSFGFFLGRTDTMRPWTFFHEICSIFQHTEETVHMISNEFDIDEFDKYYDLFCDYIKVAMGIYFVVSPIIFGGLYIFIRLVEYISNSNKQQKRRITRTTTSNTGATASVHRQDTETDDETMDDGSIVNDNNEHHHVNVTNGKSKHE